MPKSIRTARERLKTDHDTRPECIGQKHQYYAEQKQNFIKEKSEVMEQTDKMEQISQQVVYSYKYHKAIADTQEKDMREISDRINARIKFRPGEEKIFRLTQVDRQQLLKDFEGKISPNVIERCKENFSKQDIQERQAREQAKQPKVQTQSKSRGWER